MWKHHVNLLLQSFRSVYKPGSSLFSNKLLLLPGSSVINLRGVSTNKTIICFIAMQTYKELNIYLISNIFNMHACIPTKKMNTLPLQVQPLSVFFNILNLDRHFPFSQFVNSIASFCGSVKWINSSKNINSFFYSNKIIIIIKTYIAQISM